MMLMTNPTTRDCTAACRGIMRELARLEVDQRAASAPLLWVHIRRAHRKCIDAVYTRDAVAAAAQEQLDRAAKFETTALDDAHLCRVFAEFAPLLRDDVRRNVSPPRWWSFCALAWLDRTRLRASAVCAALGWCRGPAK